MNNRMTEEQARRKLQAARRHALRERDELAPLKRSRHIGLSGGGGFAYTCEKCQFYLHCREVVWSGALLPCQPQDQEAVLAAREDDDLVNDWNPKSGYQVEMGSTRRAGITITK